MRYCVASSRFFQLKRLFPPCFFPRGGRSSGATFPFVDFDDKTHLTDENRYSRFVKFVYAVILAKSALQVQPLIKRFHFRSRDSEELYDLYSDFNIWVNAAVNYGIEHLHFIMPFVMDLPCCVLSCKTLVVLKLCEFRVNVVPSANLPSLKTLYLFDTEFVEPRYLTELLNGCPVLEDLKLGVIFYIDSDQGELNTLQRLVRAEYFSNMSPFRIPLKAICNVEVLHLSEIDLPISVFPNLIHLHLGLIFEFDVTTWYLVFEMLKNCPKLQILEIDLPFTYRGPLDKVMPNLHLIPGCMSSQLRKCSLANYGGVELEKEFAKYIMQNSKYLQTMTIFSSHSKSDEKFTMLRELSLCPRSSATCELSFH